MLREENKNEAALHHAILSNLLLFPPSQVQTLSSVAINVILSDTNQTSQPHKTADELNLCALM
jgi:hypothetical protein